MQENNCDELFEVLRTDKYDTLKKDYLEFETNYKNPIKAVEDYTKKTKIEELALTEIEVKGTIYFDDFKKDIESKINFSNERFNNPISYTIKNFLPEIIKRYKEQKEYNISRNHEPRFDYEYYDNFEEINAIELYANIKAYEEFANYLFNKHADLYNKATSLQGANNQNVRVNGIILRYNNTMQFIKELHKQLYERGLINVDLKEFETHFEESMELNRMKWNGKAPEIIYLFEFLNIKSQSVYDVIVNHFFNQKGNTFKRKTLHSAKEKMSSKQINIMQIINNLKKIK